MKSKSTFLLFILTVIFLFSCSEEFSRSGNPKEHIQIENVSYIEIRKANETRDTTVILRKRLTKQDAEKFITEWNKANYESNDDSCKFFSTYWIDVTLTNGAMMTLDISGNYIRGTNKNCFCFENKNYIEQLWNEIN